MGWIRVDIDLMAHPKIRRLATRLGCSKVQAIGHIVALWAWASKFSPHGSTDTFEPEEIADGAMWEGDAAQFIQAMKESAFIDDDGILHDWQQYNGAIIEKRERDRERMQTLRKQSQDGRATVALQSRPVVGTVRYDTVRNDTDETKREDCAAQKSAPTPECAPEPPVIEFPTNTGELFPITADHAFSWTGLYPAVDVLSELRKMRGWLDANPKNRKTRRGMLRFVNGWLSREQDKSKRSRDPIQRKPWEGPSDIGLTPEECAELDRQAAVDAAKVEA